MLTGRLKTFADRSNLPYIDAMVKETLRWRCLSPVAVPHLLTADDWYEGYYIPKGYSIFLSERLICYYAYI